MSEESEKMLGVKQLPIFPLPLVLVPHELLPLHIFEPRYREMLADIASWKNMFGVSFFEPSNEFEDRPAIGTLGCVAEVRQSDTLEDGRSNLLTAGIIRYRISGYPDTEKPYLVADIEFIEDESDESPEVKSLAEEVFELFSRIAKAAHNISKQTGDLPEIPKAPPEQLSFLVTAAFTLQNQMKYEMLESRSTLARLKRAKEILSETKEHLEERVFIDRISRTNGKSKKKLNIDL